MSYRGGGRGGGGDRPSYGGYSSSSSTVSAASAPRGGRTGSYGDRDGGGESFCPLYGTWHSWHSNMAGAYDVHGFVCCQGWITVVGAAR